MYWGEGDYSVSDIDELKPQMKFSGCDWLHTLQPNWYMIILKKNRI